MMRNKDIIDELNKKIALLNLEIEKVKIELQPLEKLLAETQKSRNIYLQAVNRLKFDTPKSNIDSNELSEQIDFSEVTKQISLGKGGNHGN